MGSQGRPDGVVGDDGGLLAGATDGGGDQPLLGGQQLRGGPAALLHRPLRHHRRRPLPKEPVGQLLKLGPGGTSQLAAQGGDHLLGREGGRGRGQPSRTGQPVKHLGHRPLGQLPILVQCPTGHLPDQGIRVHAPLGRLRPPPSIQGVQGLVLLGLAGGVDGPLDQPRGPLPPVCLHPYDFQVDLVGPLGEQPDQLLGQALQLAVAVAICCRPRHPEGSGQLPLVGSPVDGVGGQPMPIQVPSVHRRPT
jgi:hypothetical protein